MLTGHAIFAYLTTFIIQERYRCTQKGGTTDEENNMSDNPMRNDSGLLASTGNLASR